MVTILNCSKPKPGMENEHFSIIYAVVYKGVRVLTVAI